MKKVITLSLMGAVLALAACSHKQAVDYGYEKQAPYSADRTVGTSTTSGNAVFKAKQNK